MDRRILVLATALSSLWLFGFTGGGCIDFGGDEPPGTEPAPPETCWRLDEASCVADPACVAVYADSAGYGGYGSGAEPACDCFCAEGEECRCACTEPAPEPYPSSFDHCEPRPQECGPDCMIYCESGNVLDENGCATCACNPAPQGCEGLDEFRCAETRGCRPEYVYDGGGTGGCACPGCFGADCPPCDCAEERPMPMPEEGRFVGCVTVDGCEGLDERSCVSTPGCEAMYGGGACPDIDCADGELDCGMCDPAMGFVGCHTAPSHGCYADSDCGVGFRCEYGGGEAPSDPPTGGDCACFCDPATPGCGPCDCGTGGAGGGSGGAAPPAPEGVCVPVEPFECRSDFECPQMDAANCWSACVQGQCVVTCSQGECATDADCPNGYCELGAACAGLDCPPPASFCVMPGCDDGTEALCDMMAPICEPGQTAAVRDGCYACVDARTCAEPQPECWGAWLDERGTCRDPADGVYPPECCEQACIQVITYAADPTTGVCMAFATPCDVPEGWGPCAER